MLMRLLLVLFAVVLVAGPAEASPRYRAYAHNLLASLPAGAKARPDLERVLNRLAQQARKDAGRPGLKASGLLNVAARAQAAEMLKGNFVGHHSKGGFRFRQRFEAFAGDDFSGFGENAARDRQPGKVGTAKARRLFQQWLDSRGHKRNLLSRRYRYVSTGAIQHGHHLYAVQIFWGE
jgi:uncharacterized protein YkwD